MKTDFANMSIDTIIGGVTPDGVSYKNLFLIEYSNLTGDTTLNASCNNCIRDYYRKYLAKMKPSTQSGYRLKEKYNGIQLEKCSPVFVTNANLTTELAEQLLKNRGAFLFDKMPEKITIVEPTTQTATQPKRRGRTKKQ
jgi:hypothetical protein